MEGHCQITEIVRRDGLQLVRLHGKHLDQDLRGLFNGMHQTEGEIEALSGTEHSMMRPDHRVILFHQLSGLDGDLPSAGNHPSDHAHAVREHDRTLRSHFPQLSGKDLVLQRKHEGQCDHIRGMGMIDHPMLSAADPLLHLMVHQMRGELAGRAAALHKAPALAVIFALLIDLDDGQAGLRIHNDIPEVFPGSRNHEKFPGQIRHADADRDPLALLIQTIPDDLHLFRLDPIRKIAAVPLMPALLIAVVRHLDKVLHKFRIQNFHFFRSFL